MVEEFGDCAPVGDDEAIKAPLVAEDVGLEVVVGGSRDAVEGVEAGHHGGCAGLDGCVVRREIDLAEGVVGHVGCVIVTAGDGGSIGGVVLDADGDGVGLGEVVLLVAVDPGTGDGGAEPGVFAGGLDDASPAGVAGDIDHGREDPLEAVGAGLDGGGAGDGLDEGGIPTGGESDGDGEGGVLAVDDVLTEDEGDVEAALFDGDLLVVVGLFRVGEIEEGADLTLTGEIFITEL